MLNRPPGQYDAFISSDEGSDMDVSDSEVDEPTIAQPSPFVAVAPSDFNKPAHFEKGGSFVSNMRNFAAAQARDPSNHVTPRVEHFATNSASEPIQVDSDSDADSASSFHTAPSSPREDTEDLEKEIQLLTETIEKNNKAIGNLKTEISELSKKKSDLNLKILKNKVRNSMTKKKRVAPRELPKVAALAANEAKAKPMESKTVDNNKLTVESARIITNNNKGKQKAPLQQPLPQQAQSLPHPPRPLSQPPQSIQKPQVQPKNTGVSTNMDTMASDCIIIDPQPEAEKTLKNTENNLENTKEINMKRKTDEKKDEKDAKKLKNLILKDKLRSEKDKKKMEMSNKATELAKQMALENSQEDITMEEGELLDSNSNSSENSVSGSGISKSSGISGSTPGFQVTPQHHISKNIPNVIRTGTQQQTANRNNFRPYKSALSSVGLNIRSKSGDSQDKPLCTFEQNGGTCNNDSCQAAHFRDFL